MARKQKSNTLIKSFENDKVQQVTEAKPETRQGGYATTHDRFCLMARIRSGNRSKADVVAAVSRDIDFGHFWRQLRARGWKYRRPKGIETKGSYVNADGSKVLVGEEAVVAYALESGLLDANENSADEVSGALDQASGAMHQANASVGDVSGAVGDVSAAVDQMTATVDQVGAGVGEASAAVDQVTDTMDQVGAGVGLVSMSQIDTSVMLSQRTMNELFGTSSSCSGAELGREAATETYNSSNRELRGGVSNLQLLSEASGAESDAQPDSGFVAQSVGPPTLAKVTTT
ncbi:unnamed protein product [Phytophthora fragariaefolia]|uniref:Unnamed protein product n=1 Tax=Phytophthora fragariaefolia TaxID=1490495 RepID=A0A9W6WUN1_9STRA|nr:unnamed protein product [Phytophthora fragariaefolia]